MSPARVSQAIKKQERGIGAELFARDSRNVRLTPVGVQLRADLLPIYQGLRESMERARLAARGMTGVLRVGMLPSNAHDRHSANSTLLFTQQSDKAWKLALIVDPPAAGTSYPPPALDAQGYAQEVTPNATGYAMTPQEIPATATNTKAAELLATGTCTSAPQTPKKAKAPPAARDIGWSSRSNASASAYPIHALKTAGPALVWIATNVTRTLRRTNPRSSWNYGLLYTGAKKSNVIFRKKLTTKHIATTVIINPAKTPGAATNKPSALACGGATVSYTGN